MKKIDFMTYFNVSRETLDLFCEYEALLSKWNKKINLVSKKSLFDIWERHFLDSGQIINHVEASGKKWVDLGSGAGFPGLVVALLLRDRKIDCDIILVEKNMKKVLLITLLSFTSHIAYGQNNQISILNQHIAQGKKVIEAYFTPMAKSFGAGLNNGWYNTAKPHSLGGFDIT